MALPMELVYGHYRSNITLLFIVLLFIGSIGVINVKAKITDNLKPNILVLKTSL